MKGPDSWRRLHLALGLHSVAIVAFQLALMQVLALTQWDHFAAMVISLALLGFGAAGTVIALFRAGLLLRLERLLPLLLFAGAALTAGVVPASQVLFGGFDSYLLFFDSGQVGRLLLLILLFALPFFCGALVIGLIFVRQVERIGTLYFANLLGSGMGGIAGIALAGLMAPARLPAVIALFTLAAGILLLPRRHHILQGAGLAALLAIGAFFCFPPPLEISQYKELRSALNLPGARIVAERPGLYGLIQAVSAPGLREAPGLSLAYPGSIPERDQLFHNGNGLGAVPRWPPGPGALPLDYTTTALPYALGTPRSVLLLHAGTGAAVAQALAHGAARVTAVEPNRAALDLLRRHYPDTAGRLLDHPALTLAPLEPRTFLARNPARYDLIALPAAGAFGGSAGLFALREQNLLTVEGLAALWRQLAPDGVLCLSAWLDYPPRHPLRLAATLAEALAGEGLADLSRHLAAVRSWGTVTFCLKRSPLTPAEAEQVRVFCRDRHFDPLLLPGLRTGEREGYHRLEDRRFFADLDRILSGDREELYGDYLFRLRPATDDRPFFSQFLRWRTLPHLARLMGERALPFLEIGYLLVILSFLLLAAAAVVLILLPLVRLGWRGDGRLGTLTYFGGLGIGFMLVEIVLVHRFVLYLGHPVYAAAAVICAVLVWAGAGSWVSSRLPAGAVTPSRAAGAVALFLLLYTFFLPPLMTSTMALPLAGKVLFTLVLVAPPAFLMGLPFPLGLQHLARRREADVPWAWGINGCLSVVSTALATIIAVEAGFTAVFLCAAAAYGGAALGGRFL